MTCSTMTGSINGQSPVISTSRVGRCKVRRVEDPLQHVMLTAAKCGDAELRGQPRNRIVGLVHSRCNYDLADGRDSLQTGNQMIQHGTASGRKKHFTRQREEVIRASMVATIFMGELLPRVPGTAKAAALQ